MKGRHWYRMTALACQVCGKREWFREYVNDQPRPDDWRARVKEEHGYCGCLDKDKP